MIASLSGALLLLQFASSAWEEAPPLPRPVTGNAVAALEREDGSGAVFSFFSAPGDGGAPLAVGFRWDVGGSAWEEIAGVPGPGRLGATAQVLRGRVYLVGGRSRGADGVERTLPSLDIYDPATGAWSQGAPLPVPVADAASATWRDSLLYVIAGRGDAGAVSEVQVYDPSTNRWSRATPLQGPPVYGHAGAVARDMIVYIDGALGGGPAGAAADALEAASWRGDIDPADPTTIRWARLPDHPGPAVFGAASGVVGTRVLFLGGADRPHDRAGTGEGSRAVNPLSLGLSYDVASGGWRYLRVPATPTMDHRALARVGGYLLLVGGMESGGRPTPRVRRVSVVGLLAGP